MNTIILFFDSVSLILFILSIVFLLKYRKSIQFGKSYIPFESKIVSETYEPSPVLVSFSCNHCGSAVNMNYSDIECRSCKNNYIIPKDYQSIIDLRRKQNNQLLKIQKVFKRYSFYTSVPFKIIIIFLFLAVITFFLILFFKSKRISFEIDYFSNPQLVDSVILVFTYLFIVSFYMTVIISIGNVFERFTSDIPRVFNSSEFILEESLHCASCGAVIIFSASVVSRKCIYCGVENYRSKFARELEQVLTKFHLENARSLIDLDHRYKSRMYELLVVPSVVYSVCIFLPVVLFIGIKISSYF